MKHVISLAMLLFALLGWVFFQPMPADGLSQGPLPSVYDPGITLNQAIKKTPDKPILLEVYVDWCGYCQKATPILNTVSKTYGDRLTFVMMNAERTDNSKILNQFRVRGYPSVYFIDTNHRLLYKIPNHYVLDSTMLAAELERLTSQ
ncbi:MAG: conjugal transfer protein TraF [Cyanobacteria bacterium HKST-UBA04]|nr:conjugal transfer protein TraF [Cyanobacteria bacterium HKST-UBA04]MCA9841141.1 conjugal transfer protein TraF [Cyanobacteria bacterium HKST-UBA03]